MSDSPKSTNLKQRQVARQVARNVKLVQPVQPVYIPTQVGPDKPMLRSGGMLDDRGMPIVRKHVFDPEKIHKGLNNAPKPVTAERIELQSKPSSKTSNFPKQPKDIQGHGIITNIPPTKVNKFPKLPTDEEKPEDAKDEMTVGSAKMDPTNQSLVAKAYTGPVFTGPKGGEYKDAQMEHALTQDELSGVAGGKEQKQAEGAKKLQEAMSGARGAYQVGARLGAAATDASGTQAVSQIAGAPQTAMQQTQQMAAKRSAEKQKQAVEAKQKILEAQQAEKKEAKLSEEQKHKDRKRHIASAKHRHEESKGKLTADSWGIHESLGGDFDKHKDLLTSAHHLGSDEEKQSSKDLQDRHADLVHRFSDVAGKEQDQQTASEYMTLAGEHQKLKEDTKTFQDNFFSNKKVKKSFNIITKSIGDKTMYLGNDEGKLFKFMGSPYHAKAMEICAKKHRVRAKLQEIPNKWDGSDSKNNKAREKLYTEQDKLCADWLRLEADLLEWKAKECRKEDPMQKSFNVLVREEKRFGIIEK